MSDPTNRTRSEKGPEMANAVVSFIGVILFFIVSSTWAQDGGVRAIGKCDRYIATTSDTPGEVVVNDKQTRRVVSRLKGNGDLDSFGNVYDVLFSSDASLVAYSVGTSSAGSEIRLFALNVDGTTKQLAVPAPPLDLSNANHVYQTPCQFYQGKLLYDIAIDRKVSHCSYDLKTGQTKIVDNAALTKTTPSPSPLAVEAQTTSQAPEEKLGDWLKKAESGDAYCQAIVGMKYRIGDGVSVDLKKALKFSSDSSAQGNPLGAYNLGRLYEAGQGVEKDPKRASECFSRAVPGLKNLANLGDAYAQVGLGTCLAIGKGIEKNQQEAVQWYRKAAEQGNAGAQVNLGNCLADDRGVEKDEREAVQWYRKAAEQGFAEGQVCLGRCLANGTGTEKNEWAAVQWFRKAAEQGHAVGQGLMGECLANGIGIEKDQRESVQWYRQAAEQGLAQGQVYLGAFLEFGTGTKKNEREAVQWYRKAAEQGFPRGQANLGACMEKGIGVEKNEPEAVQWYRKAAEQGDAFGQFKLGVCLVNGKGIEKDEHEALQWFRKAADQGNKEAAKQIEQWELIYAFRTSLPGGPEPEVIINILSDLLRGDPSARRGMPGRDKENSYQIGIPENDIVSACKTNEYTRMLDGETVYYFDFCVKVDDRGTFKFGEPSCSFVKRGRRWYPYSYNGTRIQY